MLASGLYVAGYPLSSFTDLHAELLGRAPKLADGHSIFTMIGKVKINGRAASMDTFISARDKVETGARSHIIFVVGKDAFILRSEGSLQLEAEEPPPETEKKAEKSTIKETSVSVMRLVTGKLLSVFGKHKIINAVATIGIRGTGIYVESDPEESYSFKCYGTTDLGSINAPEKTEIIVSTHHSAPRYITPKASEGKRIHTAPFKNHDNEELLLIGALVGRDTPFAVPGSLRSRSKRY